MTAQPAYIVYEIATGAVRWPALGDASQQKLEDGLAALPMPGTIMTGAMAIDDVQTALCQQIDEGCGLVRRQFVTDITGQAATYQMKLAEARGWTEGDDAEAYPYLGREAAKRGMSMAALVAEVLAIADLWVGSIDPELESSRVAAKKAVLAAETIPDALMAGQVEWTAIVDAATNQD